MTGTTDAPSATAKAARRAAQLDQARTAARMMAERRAPLATMAEDDRAALVARLQASNPRQIERDRATERAKTSAAGDAQAFTQAPTTRVRGLLRDALTADLRHRLERMNAVRSGVIRLKHRDAARAVKALAKLPHYGHAPDVTDQPGRKLISEALRREASRERVRANVMAKSHRKTLRQNRAAEMDTLADRFEFNQNAPARLNRAG